MNFIDPVSRVCLATAASLLLVSIGIGDDRPRPTVYAWFPAHFGNWRTHGIQWECLTHLCFRSVELTAKGEVRRVSGNPPQDFVEMAHGHGGKRCASSRILEMHSQLNELGKHF